MLSLFLSILRIGTAIRLHIGDGGQIGTDQFLPPIFPSQPFVQHFLIKIVSKYYDILQKETQTGDIGCHEKELRIEDLSDGRSPDIGLPPSHSIPVRRQANSGFRKE